MPEFIEIHWTSGSIDEARKVARYLVQERYVACAQISPWGGDPFLCGITNWTPRKKAKWYLKRAWISTTKSRKSSNKTPHIKSQKFYTLKSMAGIRNT